MALLGLPAMLSLLVLAIAALDLLRFRGPDGGIGEQRLRLGTLAALGAAMGMGAGTVVGQAAEPLGATLLHQPGVQVDAAAGADLAALSAAAAVLLLAATVAYRRWGGRWSLRGELPSPLPSRLASTPWLKCSALSR